MARTEGQWKRGIGFISPSEDVPVLLRNTYLNFGGSTVGETGYGFRDNAGVMEVKNDGGAWAVFGAGGGSGDMTKAVYDPAAINEQLVGLIATQTLSNKTLTSPVLNTAISGTAVLDEDDMNSDSATQIATQQSIKAYVDTSVAEVEALVVSAKVNEVAGITAGQVVYLSGATGGFPQVSLASNDDYTKSDVLAIANETKTNGQTISVTLSGIVDNLDTTAFTEGQLLYLGTSGNITTTHPTGLDAVVRIGRAIQINVATGSIGFVVDSLTEVDTVDDFMRNQLVNTSTGTSAVTNTTLINDADHYVSLNINGSNSTFGASEGSLFNKGYGDFLFVNDGNVAWEWYTDVSDLHNGSYTRKMILNADGKLELGAGTGVNEFSIDGTLAGNSDDAVPTEKAVKTYADTKASAVHTHTASEVTDFDTEVSNNASVTLNTAKLTADTTNVTSAGALMDSEVTNLTQVKAFDSTDYATAAQGSTADAAMQDLVDDTTPTLGGELDAGANSIGFTMQTATGDGTTTVDWKLGNHVDFTFGAFNEVFTFTAPTKPGVYTMSLLQDSVGSRTATFPGTVKWAGGGTAPTLTTTATTGYDLVSFRWDGTNYYSTASLDFS